MKISLYRLRPLKVPCHSISVNNDCGDAVGYTLRNLRNKILAPIAHRTTFLIILLPLEYIFSLISILIVRLSLSKYNLF